MSVRVKQVSMGGEGAILRTGGRDRLHAYVDQIYRDGVAFQQCSVREVMDLTKNNRPLVMKRRRSRGK